MPNLDQYRQLDVPAAEAMDDAELVKALYDAQNAAEDAAAAKDAMETQAAVLGVFLRRHRPELYDSYMKSEYPDYSPQTG